MTTPPKPTYGARPKTNIPVLYYQNEPENGQRYAPTIWINRRFKEPLVGIAMAASMVWDNHLKRNLILDDPEHKEKVPAEIEAYIKAGIFQHLLVNLGVEGRVKFLGSIKEFIGRIVFFKHRVYIKILPEFEHSGILMTLLKRDRIIDPYEYVLKVKSDESSIEMSKTIYHETVHLIQHIQERDKKLRKWDKAKLQGILFSAILNKLRGE